MAEFGPSKTAILARLATVASLSRVYDDLPKAAPQDVPCALYYPAEVVGVARSNGQRTTLYSQRTRILAMRGEDVSEALEVLETIRDELLEAFDPDEAQTLGGAGFVLTDQRVDEPTGVSYPAGDPASKFVGFDMTLDVTHTKTIGT